MQRLDIVELRLFIEELACSICRFMHVSQDGVEPQSVRIKQEVQLGTPNAFADIVVRAPGMAGYIVEVDYGYSLERIAESLSRKYQRELGWFKSISKLILIFDRDNHPDDQELEKHVRTLIPVHWELELWDEYRLLERVRNQFGVEVNSLEHDRLLDVRIAIDRAKGIYAFSGAYDNSPLDAALLWHLGYWRLRELFESAGRNKRAILPPSTYSEVAVVFADLSGFSGYVRDTPNDRTIQECLTAFCSKARYQIINDGGMLYQFLGDSVIGFFGIPNRRAAYVDGREKRVEADVSTHVDEDVAGTELRKEPGQLLAIVEVRAEEEAAVDVLPWLEIHEHVPDADDHTLARTSSIKISNDVADDPGADHGGETSRQDAQRLELPVQRRPRSIAQAAHPAGAPSHHRHLAQGRVSARRCSAAPMPEWRAKRT